MEQYYLRIEDNYFGFVVEGINEIKLSDQQILKDEYELFFEKQAEGKQFRVKETSNGNGLFDYIEEYIPEVEVTPEPGLEEIALDHEYRISKLELGV